MVDSTAPMERLREALDLYRNVASEQPVAAVVRRDDAEWLLAELASVTSERDGLAAAERGRYKTAEVLMKERDAARSALAAAEGKLEAALDALRTRGWTDFEGARRALDALSPLSPTPESQTGEHDE